MALAKVYIIAFDLFIAEADIHFIIFDHGEPVTFIINAACTLGLVILYLVPRSLSLVVLYFVPCLLCLIIFYLVLILLVSGNVNA